jgi:hypothetical protein
MLPTILDGITIITVMDMLEANIAIVRIVVAHGEAQRMILDSV